MEKEKYYQAVAVLEQFLSAPERQGLCLDVDEALGAMMAIISSPESDIAGHGSINELALGLLVLRGDASGEESWFDEEGELRRAWIVCLNYLSDGFYGQTYSLKDEYGLDDSMAEPPIRLRHWCAGYLNGYFLTEEFWEEALDALSTYPELEGVKGGRETMLSILSGLAEWDSALNKDNEAQILKEALPLLLRFLDENIVQQYSLVLLFEKHKKEAQEETSAFFVCGDTASRRDGPCPCGSGQQYKKCCLH